MIFDTDADMVGIALHNKTRSKFYPGLNYLVNQAPSPNPTPPTPNLQISLMMIIMILIIVIVFLMSKSFPVKFHISLLSIVSVISFVISSLLKLRTPRLLYPLSRHATASAEDSEQ